MTGVRMLTLILLAVFVFYSEGFPSELKALQAEYQTLSQAVDNPDLIWIPESFLWQERFMTRKQLEESVMTKLMAEKRYRHDTYFRTILSIVESSKNTKKEVQEKLLPQIEKRILNLGGSVTNATQTASNQKSTGASSSKPSSISPGADDANGGRCPETNTGTKNSFKLYPDGKTSGNTYTSCGYFKNGDIKWEKPYINGKLQGLLTIWNYDKKNNIHYVYERSNWAGGKLDGLKEYYRVSQTGAVYRQRLLEYSDGKQHGDGIVWQESGHYDTVTNYFNGEAVKSIKYKKDGSIAYCTKWGSDRKPRDCYTGKLR